MKFTVRGHDYSVEWLATCTGLFMACAWLLVLLVVRAGDVGAKDFISVAAFFGIGFSTMELIGAREIFWLWHDETMAFRAEAWRRYQAADREAAEIRDGAAYAPEESREVAPVYQEVIPLNTARGKSEIVIDRPLTAEELAWGQAIIKTLLHAWHTGSIKSDGLAGKGKPISQPRHWVEITNVLRDMGMVSKSTAGGTEMLMSYEMAVEQVIPSLRRVALPRGKPPRVAPPPQADYKKIGDGPNKTKDEYNA